MRARRPLIIVLAALALFGLACMHPGASSRKMDRIERKVDQVIEMQEESLRLLNELVAQAKAQGTGEITLFFPWNSSRLPHAQRERLIGFLDHLAREAHGRPLLLVSIGSADDWRREDWNQSLSLSRASAPRYYVSRHLMHVPHAWHKVKGVGSKHAPETAHGQSWRHVRLIAVYEESQLPDLPE